MKIRGLLTFELPIILSTLFFTGIVMSGGALYEFQISPMLLTVDRVATVIGLTFLTGLLALHFTAKSVKQTVVYLEPKQEQDHKQNGTGDSDNQLVLDPIHQILRRGKDVSQHLINELARQLNVGQAALYVSKETTLELKCGFALSYDHASSHTYAHGEGLIGRVAKEGKSLYIDKLPQGYITIFSGLGSASPTYLALVPLNRENEVKGVLEIASFKPLSTNTLIELENIGKAWAETGV
jgi:transcriptional regulator with GAF, ATPase, and Fis domain